MCERLSEKFQTDCGAISSIETTSKYGIAVSDEIKNLVKQFYEREDISRLAPGRKDVVIIRNSQGEKSKVQARHLTTTIKEVHATFKEENLAIKIGRSKFVELRPNHVLLSSKLPRNVCLCKYHENFILATNELNKAFSEFPVYDHKLAEKFICPSATKDCWFNKCFTCKDAKVFRSKFSLAESQPVTWYVWRKNTDGRLCKMVEEGTTDDLFDHISLMLPKFLEHCYVKRSQANSYAIERESVGSQNSEQTRAMLQVDFSENYTCKFQDEIQSAHWNQSQVSLFTAAVWFDGKLHPKVIASDNLNHSKETVLAYMDFLLENIPSTVETVSIWSDGASSQFKNKYIAAAIPILQEKHKLKIRWNYFATSHGKGPVDGIGGSVKRQVWAAVSTRKALVTNAASFSSTAKQVCNVDVVELNSEEIHERNTMLNLDEIFKNAHCSQRYQVSPSHEDEKFSCTHICNNNRWK